MKLQSGWESGLQSLKELKGPLSIGIIHMVVGVRLSSSPHGHRQRTIRNRASRRSSNERQRERERKGENLKWKLQCLL